MLHTIPLGIVSSTAAAYLIEQSLLFNDDDSAYLSRTPSVAGNRKTWTFSTWVKLEDVSTSANHVLFSSGTSSTDYTQVVIGGGNDGLFVRHIASSTTLCSVDADASLRDASAWYHIVVVFDTTDATASDRVKLYVNGVIQSVTINTQISQNVDTVINSTVEHYIGKNFSPTYFDGLMVLPILVDGAALAPTAFGETDDDGFWNPIEFTGTTTTDLISSSTGTAEDTGTTSFGYAGRVIANAFNDVTVATDANSANTASHTTPAAIGKDWGTDTLVTRAVVYGQSGSAGIHGVGTFDLTLQGWNGSAWVDLSTLAGLSGSAGQIEVLNYSGGVSYSKHRVLIDQITNSEQTAVAELQFFTESTSEGFGTNGFQLDFADSSFFGKDSATTSDFISLAAANWEGDTGNWTFSGDDISHNNTSESGLRLSDITFSGDFEVRGTWTVRNHTSVMGVYETAEDGTFGGTGGGSYSGKMVSMTNSYWVATTGPSGTQPYTGGTAGSAITNIAAGALVTMKRVGTNIYLYVGPTNALAYTWATGRSNTVRFVIGSNATMDIDNVQYRDGSSLVIGNDYFDNNFTASDQLEDTPTDSTDDGIGNFATWNALKNDQVVLSEGNLNTVGQTAMGNILSTIPITAGMKIAFEVEIVASDTNVYIGMWKGSKADTTFPPTYGLDGDSWAILHSLGGNAGMDCKYNGVEDYRFTASGDMAAGDKFHIEIDKDAGEVFVWINDGGGYVAFNSGLTVFDATAEAAIVAEDNLFIAHSIYQTAATNSVRCNFGQKAFDKTPTAGYTGLATQNLPAPTIADGSLHMNTVIYTGNGTAIGSGGNAITGVGFQPDFVWIKNRDATDAHRAFDSVRGATKYWEPDTNIVEVTNAETLTSFDADGFTVGNEVGVNTSSEDYVAWCWKAGGAASSNTDGSITTSLSVNAEAGFSIATYSGNSTAGATLGHGLGAVPEWAIFKNMSAGGNNEEGEVYHVSVGNANAMELPNNNAEQNTQWNNTTPTSSVFTVGSGARVNQDTMVAYFWTPIEGFSKFGNYTGNGSADGPFVYTGFRPAFVMTKRTNSTGDWRMHDTARVPHNPFTGYLRASTNEAELSGGDFDFLSNGFKIRNNGGEINASGGAFIYMAFAEQPFQGAGGVTQARAR